MSCKNKTSNDRCGSPRIPGLTMCGRHIKTATPRLWHVVNGVDSRVTLISKMWRGHAVRTLLRRAGPGVLKRAVCHNEEELVTMDSKDKYDPFDFFSFQEGGKIWWFDARSIIACLHSSLHPLNPYTRQPLTTETRRRIRDVYKYRLHNHIPTVHSPDTYNLQDIVDRCWLCVCQVLYENGFEDAEPRLFARLSKSDLAILMGYLVVDMRILAEEHPKSSKRHRYHAILKRELSVSFGTSSRTIQLQISSLLARLLHDMVDVYPFCFLVMSALYRL